jgi:hypothetical protein
VIVSITVKEKGSLHSEHIVGSQQIRKENREIPVVQARELDSMNPVPRRVRSQKNITVSPAHVSVLQEAASIGSAQPVRRPET